MAAMVGRESQEPTGLVGVAAEIDLSSTRRIIEKYRSAGFAIRLTVFEL